MDAAKRKKVAAKGWLSRICNQINELLDSDSETVSLLAIEDAIIQFEEKLRTFDEAQQEIEFLIDTEDELETEINNAAVFRAEKRAILIRAKQRLQNLTEKEKTENEDLDVRSILGSINNLPSTKLPTLQIEKFSGDYTMWSTFWDKFCAVIDASNIPVINKFSYLQSLLLGEAAAAIRGLSLTDTNYETAKQILIKRFGRSERIIFGHIQHLLKSSSTKEGSSASTSLWALYDDIQIHVRSLQNLGVGGDTYGVFLTPLVLNRLPTGIRLEWARIGEGKEGDLAFLLDFLYEEIRRRERSQTFSSEQSAVRTAPKGRPVSTASALHTQDTGGAFRSKKKCAFCEREHYSDTCDEIRALDFERRKEKIKKLGLCFKCLKTGHLSKNCSKRCFFCKGEHHSVLCRNRLANRDDKNEAQSASTVAQEVQSPHQGISYSNTGQKTTLMQVVKLKKGDVGIHVLFDSGSDRSFISASMARKLKLKPIAHENLSYSCFGEQIDHKRRQKPMKLYEFGHNETKIQLLEIENICSPMYRAAVPPDVLLPFESVPFTEDYCKGQNVQVDILIGLDCYWELVSTNCVTHKGLVAQETKFGWMLSGFWDSFGITGTTGIRKCMSMHCKTEITEELVRKMWDLDSIGIGVTEEESFHGQSDKIVEKFRTNLRFSQGRYEVMLPWKGEENKRALMNNKEQAFRRLGNLSKRLNRDNELRGRYNAVLADLEKEGIIHEIPESEMESENPVFYLPHRPVVKEESVSTKVRPVFDASSKGMNGLSLNDCLDTGPNLLPDLVQVLIRFRRHKFALVADIQKAFLQIKLNKVDQDVHRFLWDVNGVVRHMRFERVSFGVNCSPFILNATIKYHLEQFEESGIIKELRENLYMDDLLTGADSEDEILQMMNDADSIMARGGFTLTKWGSNCKFMPQTIVKNFESDSTEAVTTSKILGIAWNKEEDCFCFEALKFEVHDVPLTKRMLLSIIARIFDPLGLLTPYTITLKILFQDAWKLGVEWDQSLPFEMQKETSRWIEGLGEIQRWKIPRRLTENWQNSYNAELISFSDASEKAYGCCIYLKIPGDTAETNTVYLVMSKVRVAPLKRITLPRLELMSAVLSARLLKYVHSSLQLNQDCPYTCYSDSQITLHWIQGEPSRWKQFVSNRVTEIQNLTDVARWKHCRSKENPADLLTRGLDANTLSNSTFWLRGPQWLLEPNARSRSRSDNDEDSNADDLEPFPEDLDKQVEMEEKKEKITFVVHDTDDDIFSKLDKFGKWEKLVRVCGWVLRFVKNCRSKMQNKDKQLTDHLKQEETNDAKEKIILNLQRTCYREELKNLQRGSIVDRKSSIVNLSPFIGRDGLLRVKGRLNFAPGLYYDEKHPIILPKCHISYLIVKAQHEVMKHAGVNTLISALRSKYWIVGVRTLAKRICKQCMRCQRQNARPMDQVTAPLPEDRLTQSPPFHVTGVDHAGPLFCKDKENKLYILIFTCAVTRAVHLELVESLSLDDFLLAFRRFSARRGLPTIIYTLIMLEPSRVLINTSKNISHRPILHGSSTHQELPGGEVGGSD